MAYSTHCMSWALAFQRQTVRERRRSCGGTISRSILENQLGPKGSQVIYTRRSCAGFGPRADPLGPAGFPRSKHKTSMTPPPLPDCLASLTQALSSCTVYATSKLRGPNLASSIDRSRAPQKLTSMCFPQQACLLNASTQLGPEYLSMQPGSTPAERGRKAIGALPFCRLRRPSWVRRISRWPTHCTPSRL